MPLHLYLLYYPALKSSPESPWRLSRVLRPTEGLQHNQVGICRNGIALRTLGAIRYNILFVIICLRQSSSCTEQIQEMGSNTKYSTKYHVLVWNNENISPIFQNRRAVYLEAVARSSVPSYEPSKVAFSKGKFPPGPFHHLGDKS
jgi:hypothetical protein